MFSKLYQKVSKRVSRGMGIDLGTANTLVHVQGRGIMLREPSVVAIERETNRLLEVGEEAKRMIGRTPDNVLASRPMKDGVIADFEQVEKMLRFFIEKVNHRRPLLHPQVVVGVPSGITEVERLAVIEAARKAGARDAYLLDEPMAAAIGAGLPWTEPVGSMIVDIGGGTTEVAVISFRGIVTSGSIRVAGDEIDEAVIEHVRRRYKLCIGYRTAEQTKIDIGSAYTLEEELTIQVRGRDLINGLPKQVSLGSKEIRDAIAEPVNRIVALVKATLEATPPELASDILEQGITLAGGGALLRGLDTLIAEATGMPVRIAKDPLSCVVIGAGIFLDDLRVNARLHNSSYNAQHIVQN